MAVFIFLHFFSSPEQSSRRAIVLPSATAAAAALASTLVLASASTNVKVFVKAFMTSLFRNRIADFIYLCYDDI